MFSNIRIDQVRDRVKEVVVSTDMKGVINIFGYNDLRNNRRQNLWFDCGTRELILTGSAFLDRHNNLIVLDVESVVKSLLPTQEEYDLIIDGMMEEITLSINNPDDIEVNDSLEKDIISMFKSIIENREDNHHSVIYRYPDGEIVTFATRDAINIGYIKPDGTKVELWSYYPTIGFNPDSELNIIHEFFNETHDVLGDFNNLQEAIATQLSEVTNDEEFEFSLISLKDKLSSYVFGNIYGTVSSVTYIDPENEELTIEISHENKHSPYIKVSIEYEDPIYDDGEEVLFSIVDMYKEDVEEVIHKAVQQYLEFVVPISKSSTRIS